jgi:hypothetical protein
MKVKFWCIYTTTLESILARIVDPPPASAIAPAATSQKFPLQFFFCAPLKKFKRGKGNFCSVPSSKYSGGAAWLPTLADKKFPSPFNPLPLFARLLGIVAEKFAIDYRFVSQQRLRVQLGQEE